MIENYLRLLESFKENQISKLIATIHQKILVALNSPKFNSRIAPYLKDMHTTGVPFTDFTEEPDTVSQIKKLINALYHARLAFLDLENINVRQWNRRLSDLKFLYSNTIHQAYEASYLLTHLDVDLRDIFNDEYALLLPLLNQFKTYTDNLSENSQGVVETLKTYPLSYNAGLITGVAVDQMKPNNGDLDYNFLAQFSAVLPGYLEQFTQQIDKYSSQFIEKESTLNQEKLLELQNAAFKVLTNLDELQSSHLFLPLKALNYIHIIRNVITLSMSALEQIGKVSESTQDLIREKLALLKYSVLPTLFGLVDKIEDHALLEPGTLSIPLMNKVNPLYQWIISYASKPVDFYAKGEELLSIEDPQFLALRLERTYKRIDQSKKAEFKIKQSEEAFINFFKLLDDPAHKNKSIRGLPSKIKQQLAVHYKLLKPYMTQLNVDLNNVLIDSLNQPESWASATGKTLLWATRQLPTDHLSFIHAQKEALQQLITKDKNSKKFHIELNSDLIDSVHAKTNLALFPYTGVNVLTVDESEPILGDLYSETIILETKSEATIIETESEATIPEPVEQKKLFWKKTKQELCWQEIIKDENPDEDLHHLNTEQNKILDLGLESELDDNKNPLNSEQALDLAQWYDNKRNKLIVAKDAYDNFVKLLEVPKANPDDESTFDLSKLNDDTNKDLCRNLYNIFQPYLISAIPLEEKEKALKTDKQLAHFLSKKSEGSSAPSIDLFFGARFQKIFTYIDQIWMKRSRKLKILATKKYCAENELAVLEKDPEMSHRPHHLIHHTYFSEFAKEFRKNLYTLTEFYSESMKLQLKTQTSGIPYPELEELNTTLAQPKQVLALKRLFNSLYHIEGIALELEQLNNKSTESRYVYHLLKGYGHINDIVKLTRGLIDDPHFKLIARELLEKAQELLTIIEEHSDAYKNSPENAGNGEPVQFNSLWYVLNTFFIGPQHIRTLRNNNYTTTEELNELHRQAKDATIRIEKIINSSSSYFKLFLQTPSMYLLYRKLTSKLNEFTSTTHDAVINNIDRMHSEIILPMLLEADHWERKSGLIPGVLSGPLKDITDEYFKGLLNPMGLESKMHIALVCDNKPLELRQRKAEEKINQAQESLKEIEKNYQLFASLSGLIDEYLNINDLYSHIKPSEVLRIKGQLIDQYKEVMHQLVQLNTEFNLEPIKHTEKHIEKLDTLLNENTNEYDPKLNNIYNRVKAAHHYYQGQQATLIVKSNSAQEQLNYLTQLTEVQKNKNIQFVDHYAESSFNRQMEAYCNSHLGLEYVYKEYRNELRAYLWMSKKAILRHAKNAEDIDLAITHYLTEKIKIFENINFTKYYQLDTVKAALGKFTYYLSSSRQAIQNNTSVYENQKTLNKKSKLINRLDEAADKGFLTINEHLNQITNSTRSTAEKEILIKKLKQLSNEGHLTIEELCGQIKMDSQKNEAQKKEEIDALNKTAEEVKLTIEERIEYIKTQVEPESFKGTVLAHAQLDFFSFSFLKKCILNLLEALSLYTPATKKLVNNITNAVNTPPQISELTNRFGLFSSNYSPEVKAYDVPPLLNPVAQP